MLFEVVKSNIVNIPADAIVLPANEALKEGSGASQAIFEAAGREKLTAACRELGHCDMGSAVPTLAFNLDSKFIIHAVVPKWIDGNHNEYELLCSAYLAALNMADIMECKSIAFPLLAAGNNGFDKGLAVRIAAECISSFAGSKLKRAFLIVFDDTMEVFMKGLGFRISPVPKNLHGGKKKAEHLSRWRRILSNGKDAVLNALENQVSNAIEWIKDPSNQRKIIEAGFSIYQMIKRLKG